MLYSSLRPRLGKRSVYALQDDWKFTEITSNHPHSYRSDPSEARQQIDVYSRTLDAKHWQTVRLPHSPNLVPSNGIPENDTRGVYLYQKCFRFTAQLDQRVFLVFEGAMTVADVQVNQTYIGRHLGGYTAFSWDITDALSPSGMQEILVRLDSRPQPDIPPEGGLIDYRIFGGLYRNVYLLVTSDDHVEHLQWTTLGWQNGNALVEVEAKIHLSPVSRLTNERLQLELNISNQDGSLLQQEIHPVAVNGSDEANEIVSMKWEIIVQHAQPWSPHQPHLYNVGFRLLNRAGSVLDDGEMRVGFRTLALENGQLLLNGQPIKLIGFNRHQSFPYIGYAAPKRLQRQDVWILKHELGANYVRTSHYPQDPAFFDACDELGLLVFTEIPGWQHVGDEHWQAIAKQHLVEMIERHRHHPCIFMWGVRINESADSDEFYTETNKIARALDPSRWTGGVRNFRKSHFIEDIFTFNDFSMGVLPSVQKPQLITEYLGHMYPTKLMDNETRLIQHALHHAKILNEVYQREDLVGASAWCAFDYPTSPFFGGGQQICHHGVMDQFRFPKFAAAVYRSQKPPEEEIVLEPATYLTFESADHSQLIQALDTFDDMETVLQSAAYTAKIYVFSNCNSLEVEFNGQTMGRLMPQEKEFPSLQHPPFVIPLQAYRLYGTLRLRGYLDQKVVVERTLYTPLPASRLRLHADHTVLHADGVDMTRIWVEAVDKNGMRSPYLQRVVSFSLEAVDGHPAQGSSEGGQLLGDNPGVLEAGRAALYFRAGCYPGRFRVHVQSPGLQGDSLDLSTESQPFLPRL
ncbi:glycoside hydrolase family 2 TIM barrel-domain containing protein [Alicyclobacillus tolerans]|uniref:glycoside hydrolase family 2 TIM barrel-domain containing protein n=1 Tax=Alicyclobacillus tolerans TaxID=90970 RepID=UPI003B7832BB